tara:strand:- start:3555 stop:4016 length:462 start_codon:yes stop_codon:yes gene_type:complete
LKVSTSEMTQDDNKIEINFLDHVAIRVNDIDASAAWYEEVLGLTKYQLPEWGDFPIFLFADKSGVALFPKKSGKKDRGINSKINAVDHFAFNVNKENFEKAKKRYLELKLDFTFEDHHFFHSIYTKDPDNYTVELTTLVVDEKNFYKKPKNIE